MAYNADNDICLWKEETDGENGTLTVGVYSYKGSQPKVGLSRMIETRKDFRHSGIGRMTAEEVSRVVPLLQKAAKEAKA